MAMVKWIFAIVVIAVFFDRLIMWLWGKNEDDHYHD